MPKIIRSATIGDVSMPPFLGQASAGSTFDLCSPPDHPICNSTIGNTQPLIDSFDLNQPNLLKSTCPTDQSEVAVTSLLTNLSNVSKKKKIKKKTNKQMQKSAALS